MVFEENFFISSGPIVKWPYGGVRSKKKEKEIFFPIQKLLRWCFYIHRFAEFGKKLAKNLF